MIPQLTTAGLLPNGRHLTDLPEIEDIFVTRAPNARVRKRIFRAFQLYVDILEEILPTGTLWVDGGFCTYKPDPPNDIDLVIVAEPSLLTGQAVLDLASLLTLQSVSSYMPSLQAGRLQPMGGLIDAFLMRRGAAAEEQYWDGVWSSVKGPNGKPIMGATKGYLEVNW